MLIVDCETTAIEGVTALVQPARNLTDPAKIQANIAERIEEAALNPWTARIVALGCCHEGDEAVKVWTANAEAFERTALREFWEVVEDGRGNVLPLVTFNGRGYDLPLLMVRSMLLGVKHPTLNLDRYRSPHVDLVDRLTFGGSLERKHLRSLKWYAQRFGLNTDDAFSGAFVAQLVQDGNWDAVIKHCESDVTLTRQLGERLGVLKARKAA